MGCLGENTTKGKGLFCRVISAGDGHLDHLIKALFVCPISLLYSYHFSPLSVVYSLEVSHSVTATFKGEETIKLHLEQRVAAYVPWNNSVRKIYPFPAIIYLFSSVGQSGLVYICFVL